MEYRNINDIRELPGNPRTIKKQQFKTLCKSVEQNKEYFEARPLILSNRIGELIIIAGNQRYRAAKHLKFKQVPTHLISGLTEEQEREITIRDNVNNGEWDWETLGNEWNRDDLTTWGLDIDEDDKDNNNKHKTPSVGMGKLPIKCPECGHEFLTTS